MVHVSQEEPEQARARLRRVLARADLERLEGAWCFVEQPASEPVVLDPRALAFVRDRDSSSQLVPADEAGAEVERFAVFGFHFDGALDNSGFVGWLAWELKVALGTGVFVLCGSNGARGGIYDYWGVPLELADRAAAVLAALSGS